MVMGLSDITAKSVRNAIPKCDDLSREVFRLRYRFGPAREYELVYAGRRYGSKAIIGVAHRYAAGQALRLDEVSGGAAIVARASAPARLLCRAPASRELGGGGSGVVC
jgi:hypothetical protein